MRTPLHRLWQSLTRSESTPQVTTQHIVRQYQTHPSFHHQLAVQEYNPHTRLFLLQDLTSQAAVFELTPVACEAKPCAQLETLRDQLAVALQSPLFYQDPSVTWIMQLYVQDERPLHALTQRLNQALAAVSHPLTQTYQTLLQQHLHWISQRGGIFTDQQRAHLPFVGNERRVRLVLYPKPTARHPIPTPFIQQVAKQFTQQLRQAGVGVERLDGQAVYEWFVRWFNPAPPLGDGCLAQLLQRAPYPGNAPFGFDHSQRCFFSTPQSQSPYWYFDGWPHTVVTANQLNLVPPIGWLTGERDQGEGTYALFDTFPPDAIACLTLVLGDPKRVHAHLHRVAKSARGNDPSAQRVSAQIHYVQNQLAQGHRLLSYLFSVYLRAPTQPLLEAQVRQLETTLISHGCHTLHANDELFPLDAYVRTLPMNYDPAFDEAHMQRTRLLLTREIANVLPVYGRSRGTSNPGCVFFNRGGEPFTFDILRDKTKNGHTLILGETGTGKSNLCVYLLCSLLAAHHPRLFILEAGGSFDLFAQFLQAQKLTIHRVNIHPQRPVSLNPFADGLKILDTLATLSPEAHHHHLHTTQQRLTQDLSATDDPLDAEETPRDRLGEMVMAALLMITGGEAREEAQITRADRALLVDAIVLAARTVRDAHRKQMIASDVVAALNQLADTLDPHKDAHKIQRARQMADNMAYFCKDPLSAQFFNTPGDPWPLADVTVVDFGLFAQDGYEAHRAIAYAGVNARMLALAEATQYEARPIVAVKDENHIFLNIPLLAAMQAREAKMARKLGIVLVLLTQNMADFADQARKVVSMMENFICLALPPDEIAQIERFRSLTDEERLLCQSAKKVPGQYTEGVILSPTLKGLFRNIPPRPFLTLAATDKHEKHQRRQRMQQEGLTEVQAALALAQEMMQPSTAEEEHD